MQGKEDIDQFLADSFKKIAAKEPIEKITIKEITDGAGVIRPTFYNHFQDKYELLEWIVNKDLMEPAMLLFENGFWTESVVLILKNIQKDREFYTRAAKLEGQNSFEEIFMKSINIGIMKFIDASKDRSANIWLHRDKLAAVYAHSLTFMVMAWIRSGYQGSTEDVAASFAYVCSHSPKDIMGDA